MVLDVPTELTDATEAYGIFFSNPQNGLRFARQESTEMIACIAEGYHFCVVCRMMRSIYTLCGFEKKIP